MSKPLFMLLMTLTFSNVLLSCSSVKIPEGGEVFPYDDSNPRIVNPSDYLVDYSKGDSSEFRYSHGYSNGGLFGCTWSSEAIKIEDGKLNLSLYKSNNTIYGAEYRSREMKFRYGYYATKMKAANCPGVITSFFTYTRYPVWDEIDIEILGKNMNQVQFNYYTNGVGHHEYLHNLGFDASLDFHEYGFEWLPNSITWYIDGIKIYRATKDIPSNSQNLMMNLWNCLTHDSWSGVFDESRLPVKSQYEFISYIPAN